MLGAGWWCSLRTEWPPLPWRLIYAQDLMEDLTPFSESLWLSFPFLKIYRALQGLAEHPDLLTWIFLFLSFFLPLSLPFPSSLPPSSILPSWSLERNISWTVLSFRHCAQHWEYHNDQNTFSAPIEHSVYPPEKRRKRSDCSVSLRQESLRYLMIPACWYSCSM